MFPFTKKDNFIHPPFKFHSFITDKKKRKNTLTYLLGVVIVISALHIADIMENESVKTIGAIAGMLVIIIPMTVAGMKKKRSLESIDSNLPIFVLSLISSIESGNSLLRAVEDAAGREMGTLTPELRNLRANISWGMPHKLAFQNFTDRLGTQLSKRVGILLGIALDMGGDIGHTLELVQKHVSEMQHLEKERKSELAPYLYTIYIAFFIFLIINALLVMSFFSEIETIQQNLIREAEEKDINLGMFATIIGLDVAELTNLMFNMAIIEAIFGGLAAGKISEGTFTSGIKHMIVMIVASVIMYTALDLL